MVHNLFLILLSVDMFLEFACCAAVPGGGRNKEYALHLLHLCHGKVHVGILFIFHWLWSELYHEINSLILKHIKIEKCKFNNY